jgi:hypothetical protein
VLLRLHGDALKGEKKRVIVMAHSQGTIVAAKVG